MATAAQADGLQNWERASAGIRERYLVAKRAAPERFARPIDLSWSVWMFGLEPFERSLERLRANGLAYVELKGDRQAPDAGLSTPALRRALDAAGMKASGTCGMFSPENDLASASPYARQRAIDYVRREVERLGEVGGRYLIVVPTAVGRPAPLDAAELERSADALRACGPAFEAAGVRAAVEPIRSAEVSGVHTVAQGLAYLDRVGHPAIGHLNADCYHMSLEERHVGEAILAAGARLANLHLADTNRDALGRGMLDLDTVVMAAYLVGMNEPGRFLTPEPLGPFPDPYVLSTGPCDAAVMDALVSQTVGYFRAREAHVRALA